MLEEFILIETDLKEIKSDLYDGIQACTERGLIQSNKWLCSLLISLPDIKLPPEEICSPYIFDSEYDTYLIAKSFFDSKEYDRCAFYTKNCVHPRQRFLHFYSRYLSNEKKKIENMTEAQTPPDPTKNEVLKDIYNDMKKLYACCSLDGFELYLYGVILKKLDLRDKARMVFQEAVYAAPINWSAWIELSQLICDRTQLNFLMVPSHWIQLFFYAHTHLELLLGDEALEMYRNIQMRGFEKSQYVMAQIAGAYNNCREIDKAIEMFKNIQAVDPYRLDNLDMYSNLLYVRESKSELANLAHQSVKIDKYRVETCCVIGNYYSLRGDHQKSVLYFQRALKLNPYYLSAWTLMGHEFMEMKNTNAAIHSYRQAIEVNRRDYRAWYGLGQTYEILKMPVYCLYYYKQAQQLRPNDSRMLIALGETYEKLDKIENALKCFYKASNIGDIEGIALIKLAKLYDRFGKADSAAAAYTRYCLDESRPVVADQSELYQAYRYLANYHLRKGQLDEANNYAYKCLEHEDTKEEGKSLLRTIASKRGQPECQSDLPTDETVSTSPNHSIRRPPLSPRSSNDMQFTPPI